MMKYIILLSLAVSCLASLQYERNRAIKETKAIKEEEVPECGENEAFNECGHPCFRKCITPDVCILPCFAGCYCKVGYREHPITKKCVKKSQCPSIGGGEIQERPQIEECPPDREFIECGGPCYGKCFCNNPTHPCDAGCKCRRGLLEHPLSKECVLKSQCTKGLI